jgi:hypothetical protein
MRTADQLIPIADDDGIDDLADEYHTEKQPSTETGKVPLEIDLSEGSAPPLLARP